VRICRQLVARPIHPIATHRDHSRFFLCPQVRVLEGRFESGEDIAALRRFVGLTQADFARAIEISVHTLRNWEQGRRRPEGPAIALLRIAARHPRIIRENLRSAA
jgi:DNA-binding XRE family transcriptional regulator